MRDKGRRFFIIKNKNYIATLNKFMALNKEQKQKSLKSIKIYGLKKKYFQQNNSLLELNLVYVRVLFRCIIIDVGIINLFKFKLVMICFS